MTPRRLSPVLIVALCVALAGGQVAPAVATTPRPFEGSISRLSPELRERMTGISWRRGCPVALSELRLLRMTYRGFDGDVHWGRMVVRDSQATRVRRIFRSMYEDGFKIRRMKLIDAYGGSDARSMDANNTSAFNCRKVSGTDRWSQHSYGRAIDINPVQNPWVSGSSVEPAAGREYVDRDNVRKGMIVRPGPVVRAFLNAGWYWGGDWSSSKDYQHFSSNGR